MQSQVAVRRLVKEQLRSARKTYHLEWVAIEAARQQRRTEQLAKEGALRAARIARRTIEHAEWRRGFEEREAVRMAAKQALAERMWASTKAAQEARRVKRVKALISPIITRDLIDSSNVEERVTTEVFDGAGVKLKGLPDVDICHQDELLLKYLCDPCDRHLANFRAEYMSNDVPAGDFFEADRAGLTSSSSTILPL